MIQLLRRIGFPPFKRSVSLTTGSRTRLSRRSYQSETLEARMLLAGDTLSAFQNSIDTTDVVGSETAVSLDTLAILSALSRGGGAMLAHAGVSSSAPPVVVTTPPANSASGSGNVIVDAGIVDEVIQTEDQPLQGRPLNASPAEPEAEAGDVEITIGANMFLIYNSITGELRVDTGTKITTLEIVSKSGIFTGNKGSNLNGTFDQDTDTKIFKLDPAGFSSLSFGRVAQTGLTDAFVRGDLTIVGTQLGGGFIGNKLAQIRLQITDLNANPISQVGFGEEFFVRVMVQDVRPTSLIPNGDQGVYSAYLDVTWNSALAEAVGNIQYATAYNNAKSGTVGDGLLDEVGAVATSTSPTDNKEHELLRVRMKATSAGQLKFSGNPSDVLPQHEVLVFGGTQGIDAEDITFVESQTVTVTDTANAPDLVAFAKALTASGAKFYGAGWCSACTEQKETFQDGQVFLPFVEVTDASRRPTQVATDNNITQFPTWVFANGKRLVGSQTLEKISTESGVAIPQSNKPFIVPIADVDVLSGSPLFMPIDGYDPNGGPITYTVEVSNPNVVSAQLTPNSNRSMRIKVEGYGDMVFELFDDLAPRVTEQITTLAESGFYDGLIFHRVLNNFVIQGGDPLGTGSGSSELPDFDDQFHVDLQHNSTGLLSMAKTTDDTNNSQFFITEGTSRHLDFNHSIFGKLIEGEKNRDNISNTAVNASGRPNIEVRMSTVEVFNDIENALLRLRGVAGATGTSDIIVTARDAQGHEFTETFTVTVKADTVNGGPFLEDITEVTTVAGTPLEFELQAIDVENDPVRYSGFAGSDDITFSVDPNTGVVTITPKAGFVGTTTATVRVEAATSSNTQDRYDSQTINVIVTPGTPAIDLLPGSDSGLSNSDNVTNLTELSFAVTGVTNGALVELFAGSNKIGQATATGTQVTITTSNLAALGEGQYAITARQTVDNQPSGPSNSIQLTFDQTAPGDFDSDPPTTGSVSEPITYNAEHEEEGEAGFRYSLVNAPTGASINPETGVLTWTPASGQSGTQAFGIVATDLAGNSTTQNVSLSIDQLELVQFRLQVVNSQGDIVTAVASGESFKLEVYVQDLRDDTVDPRGVFSAYLDVLYDDTRVEVVGPVTYGASFVNAKLSDTATAGIVNDTGAVASTEPLGGDEILLWSLPMMAIGTGSVTFAGDPADNLPLAETLVHGLSVRVQPDEMVFVDASINVVSMTTAQDDQTDVLEDSNENRIRVLDNDIIIPAGTIMNIIGNSTPTSGTVRIDDDKQSLFYKPNANFAGNDSFTYTIQAPNGDTSTAVVNVRVVNVNDNPTAQPDNVTVSEDSANTVLNVLANDSSAPDTGETLTITAKTDGANGTVTIDNGSSVRYTPNPGFTGSDSFTYTISDGNGGTATGQVNVTVTEVNDAPVAGRDIRSMDEDTTLTLSVSELLANDTPGDGEDDQTLTLISVQDPTVGTVRLEGSNVIVTPPANFAGTLAFTYTVRDNGTTNGVSAPKTATGTVTINVRNVNDNPTAADDDFDVQSGDGSTQLNVLANDSSAPDAGETLTISAIGTGSAGGTITRSADNKSVLYTPASGFVGTETFTYTISDGNGGTDIGSVSVNVRSFVPGGISGFVYYDANRDGERLASETGLSGVEVVLSGVSSSGQDVELRTVTDVNGRYNFAEVMPGNYVVAQIQPGFTQNGQALSNATMVTPVGSDRFELELTSAGVSGAEMNFSEQGLDPRFALYEALASKSKHGFYASVNPDADQHWSRLDTGWESVDYIDISLSDDLSTITLTIMEDDEMFAATLPRSGNPKVQMLGKDGADHLFRINGSRADFAFQPVAEGESARDAVFARGLW